MWYFTSPECAGSSGWSNLPSNSANSFCGGLPRMLTSTLRRPRWAMPITMSLHAVGAAAADQLVEQRDQAVAAFQREALLADVLGVQVALEAVGLRSSRSSMRLLLVGARGRTCRRRASRRSCIQWRCVGVGDVHELGADAAGVGRLQQRDQVAQLQPLRTGQGAGVEFGVEVGVGQAVERGSRSGAADAAAGRVPRDRPETCVPCRADRAWRRGGRANGRP